MARQFGSKNKVVQTEKGIKTGTKRAMEAMLSLPVKMAEDNPASSAERIALLLNRVKDIKKVSAPNPYQTSFVDFLFDLCVTKDEAAGGLARQLPKDPYIYEIADALITCPLLLMEKSRRVRASWIMCCFDIWLAAGGQDPRWPILMNAEGNRQIIVASRKLEGLQGSQWFLEKRIKFILDEFEKRGFREQWPAFPQWEWTANEIEFSNGSFITAIASGKDQSRGPGATEFHAEELSHWPEAKASIEGALPVLQGGGHLVAITTPNCGTYSEDIVKGRLKNRGSIYG